MTLEFSHNFILIHTPGPSTKALGHSYIYKGNSHNVNVGLSKFDFSGGDGYCNTGPEVYV